MTTLTTTILRDNLEYDVLIHFDCTHYLPGEPPGWTDPGYGPEAEFEITGIEFDSDPEDGPLTDAERARIAAWFHAQPGYDKALDAYEPPGPCGRARRL